MIQAVIFDMDGVLIDSEMIYLEFKYRFALSHNPAVKIEDLYGTVGHIAQDSWSVMEKAINNGRPWQELRKEYLELTEEDYAAIDYSGALRPEVRQLLPALKEKGFRLAVASSNNQHIIERVLSESQIASYFDCVISGEQFKRSKPSPEIYHCTAAKLGVREKDCFVIEDSTPGIIAAHRAGMTVAALIDHRFGFDRTLADHEVAQIQDILRYL